jgi:hypothetical protein
MHACAIYLAISISLAAPLALRSQVVVYGIPPKKPDPNKPIELRTPLPLPIEIDAKGFHKGIEFRISLAARLDFCDGVQNQTEIFKAINGAKPITPTTLAAAMAAVERSKAKNMAKAELHVLEWMDEKTGRAKNYLDSVPSEQTHSWSVTFDEDGQAIVDGSPQKTSFTFLPVAKSLFGAPPHLPIPMPEDKDYFLPHTIYFAVEGEMQVWEGGKLQATTPLKTYRVINRRNQPVVLRVSNNGTVELLDRDGKPVERNVGINVNFDYPYPDIRLLPTNILKR